MLSDHVPIRGNTNGTKIAPTLQYDDPGPTLRPDPMTFGRARHAQAKSTHAKKPVTGYAIGLLSSRVPRPIFHQFASRTINRAIAGVVVGRSNRRS